MSNPSLTQSQKRRMESMAALFNVTGTKELLFIKSSSDVGVIRNGGRNGARFAPQSFLSTFKKFSQSEACQDYSFMEYEVSVPSEERENFQEAQKKESERIFENIKNHHSARICHLGGGHDHVYPLLSALSRNFKKVIVINIDAHADTRTDEEFHSGTPFRQFAQEFDGEFSIYQLGLHSFANSFSTLSSLPKGKQTIVWFDELSDKKIGEIFSEISEALTPDTLVLFSLDADAVKASEVPGVSAVNPAGISRAELIKLWDHYETLNLPHPTIIGIYELNPVYDTLASLSMRTLASFVFETLRK